LRVEKGPEAFRTISEAAEAVGVPQHVLRFWETRFAFIRPMKRAGGRRFYRPADLELLKGVRVLLQDEGYTIKGVQRLQREQGSGRLLAAARGEGAPPPRPEDVDDAAAAPAAVDGATSDRLAALLDVLTEAKHDVDAALARCASRPV
jgi:DNA-binding transcriptional MerR regulator